MDKREPMMMMIRTTLSLALAIPLLLAAGPAAAQDIKRGEKLFTDCKACHTLEPGGSAVGPSLAGVIGRKAGTADGFRFSPAMKRSDITWTPETLATFIADPQKVVPANRMPYAGMPDAKDVKDLIAYLAKAGGAAK